MKVLLIDDHPLIVAALQSVIKGLGENVTVDAADSGRAARDTLRADANYDLVLLDLHLGDADGFDLLGEFRSRFGQPFLITAADCNPAAFPGEGQGNCLANA